MQTRHICGGILTVASAVCLSVALLPVLRERAPAPEPVPPCAIVDTGAGVIAAPGLHCFDRDVVRPAGLRISSSGVTLDLRGHCLRGAYDPHGLTAGITIDAGVRDVAIINGCIEGFLIGILADGDPSRPASSAITIENLDLRRHTFRGVRLIAGGARVIGNRVTAIGGSRAYDDAFAMGLEISGDDCLVAGNLVRNVYPTDSGEGVGISISELWARRCVVARNDVRNARLPEWGRTFGIWARAGIHISANVVANHTFTYASPGLADLTDNVSLHEACSGQRGSLSREATDSVYVPGNWPCSERLEVALRRVTPDNRNSLVRVAAIHHTLGNWEDAVPYYYAAGVLGSAEAARQVDRFRSLGLISDEIAAAAHVRALELGLLPPDPVR